MRGSGWEVTVDGNVLRALATAPLDRVLVSAAGTATGVLSKVSGMLTKEQLPTRAELLALAVAAAEKQDDLQGVAIDGKPILCGATPPELAGRVVDWMSSCLGR